MGQFVSGFRRGGVNTLGWHAEVPDINDPVYHAPSVGIAESVDLRTLYPDCFQKSVEDQGQTSSCVGNATVTGLEYCWMRTHKKFLNFSRMGVYALARKKIGWLQRDSGCFIRDAAYQIANIGICLESFHPFKLDYLYRDLDLYALEQCSRHKISNVRRVDRNDFESVLNEHKIVVGGITVYQECVFGEEAQTTGYIRKPVRSDTFGGGHALLFAGYDRRTGRVKGPNSWSNRWGDDGWFSMDLDYIKNSNLSDDFWTFDVV